MLIKLSLVEPTPTAIMIKHFNSTVRPKKNDAGGVDLNLPTKTLQAL